MRKLIGTLGILALLGLWLASPVAAQWGAIQSGVDAAKKAKEAGQQPPPQQQQQPTKAYEGSASDE